jgi:SAM-dependent methyltransferase
MRLVPSIYLNDGKRFNDGRPVTLLYIENPDDFDAILNNIARTNYYDKEYFEREIGHSKHQIKVDNLYLSAITEFLGPRHVLDLGCGHGEVLLLLNLRGVKDSFGIDLSHTVLEPLWSPLKGKVECGDLLEVCKKYTQEKRFFDTFLAFDIWEHLHPLKLQEYIRSMLNIATPNALFFFIIPAIGTDRVFGEVFPLEFEENRSDLEAGRPFKYMVAGIHAPPIPASGHLTWAPSIWWEEQFKLAGLQRVEALEANIHKHFDCHLFHAQKSFFIFSLNTNQSQKRVTLLLEKPLDQSSTFRLLINHYQALSSFASSIGRKDILNSYKIIRDINYSYYKMCNEVFQHIDDNFKNLFGKGFIYHLGQLTLLPTIRRSWHIFNRFILGVKFPIKEKTINGQIEKHNEKVV